MYFVKTFVILLKQFELLWIYLFTRIYEAKLRKDQGDRNTPLPESRFLGSTNYINNFIYNYDTVTFPLHELLLKENNQFIRNEKQTLALKN